jgi:hypothetical protein
MKRLSGDQKGRIAPSVPARCCAESEPSGRTQSFTVPLESMIV